MSHDLEGRDAKDEPIHKLLKAAVERRTTSYLWVKGDTPPFKPALLGYVYGDGRALFALSTINQRPRYWIIRGDSSWQCGLDREDADGPEFAELTDGILSDLEEWFGRGRCGHTSTSLFNPRKERMQWCRCEECSARHVAHWPEVDDDGGCSWDRMNWPKGFATLKNPAWWRGDLLDIPWVPAAPKDELRVAEAA